MKTTKQVNTEMSKDDIMDTVLIDENELKAKLVSNIQKINESLIDFMRKKAAEMGVNPDAYVGGISCAISSEYLNLESNINNLIAAYSSNFGESIFFQFDSIKKMETIAFIERYLTEKNLIADFTEYKEQKRRSRHENTHILPEASTIDSIY